MGSALDYGRRPSVNTVEPDPAQLEAFSKAGVEHMNLIQCDGSGIGS
jgi:hypothetical protein